MTSSTCWRCLLRPSTSASGSTHLSSTSSTVLYTRSFSTTLTLKASPVKKRPVISGQKVARASSVRLPKSTPQARTSKPPAPGERRAARKRIVLSNTNALEVPGMTQLSEDNLEDESLKATVIALPGPVVDSLRAVEAFKTTQAWNFFRRPGILMREESLELASKMRAAEEKKSTFRKVYTGDRGVGKSMMVLHGMATAFVKDWVVVNIPDAMELTMAHTAYAPLPDSQPTQYIQKNYISTLLSQIVSANNKTLSTLQVSQEHQLPIPLQSNITLARLAELGFRDPEIAWPIFNAFWTELTKRSTTKHPRPPMLISVDGLRHIMRLSEYRNPDFELIHSHDLAFVKLIVDYLSGTAKLPNGGAVLASTSASSIVPAPTFDLAIEQAEARSLGAADIPRGSPFEKHDERVLAALKNVEVKKLKGLSRQEARGLMEYYAASGIVRDVVDDRYVSEKWTIASGGIVGELEKSTLRIRG